MWVARNPDGKYHLFDIKPVYDEWYEAWGEPGYRKANDALTIQYLRTHYKTVTSAQLGFTMDWTDTPIEIETLIKVKHPNKERKERTANERPLNKYLNEHGSKCEYFDGFTNDHPITECFAPWADKCKGNKFDCDKLKYKWLSSLSEEKRNIWLEEHEGLAK